MELLDNPIRGYAWGSRTAIAGLQGRRAPTREPEAELWIGAHPEDPSGALATPPWPPGQAKGLWYDSGLHPQSRGP